MGLPIYFNQKFSENNTLTQKFGFNSSLDSFGNTLIVGTYGSGVYVYESGGLNQNNKGWFLTQKLTGQNIDDSNIGLFGYSAKLNGLGNIIVASSPAKTGLNEKILNGSAYIYVKNNTNWSLFQELTGINRNYEYFGQSLDINYSGDIIAVGSRGNLNSGQVYIYKKDISDWKLNSIITGTPNTINYPNSISLNESGNILAFGAPYENQNSGKVYVLDWKIPQEISLNGFELTDNSEDINGKYIYQNISPFSTFATTGYKHESLNSWIYFSLLNNRWELEANDSPEFYNDSSDINILPFTGWKIGLAQGTPDEFSAGTLNYILKQITGDNKVINFGIDLDLNNSGDKLLIGSLNSDLGSGAAYLFTGNNLNYILSKKFTGEAQGYENFGNKVTLNGEGNVSLVSSYNQNNENGNLAGAVYLFENNGSWILNKKITGDGDFDYGDNFGFSIDLNNAGNIAVIGAIGDGYDNKGAVYIFSDSNIQYSDTSPSQNLIFGNKPVDLLCPTKNSSNFLINLKGEENFSSPYNTKHKFILYKSGEISGYLPIYESNFLSYNNATIKTYSGLFNSGNYQIKVKSIYNDTNISFPSLCNSGIQLANIIDLSYSNRSGLALFKSNSILFKDFLNKNSKFNEIANVYFLDSLNITGLQFTTNFTDFINSTKVLEPLEKTKEGVALNDAIDYAIYNLSWNSNYNKKKIINIITNNFPYIESDANDCDLLDPYFTNPIEIKYSGFLNKIATYSSNQNISFNFIYLDKELNDEIDKKNFFYNEKELKTLYAKASQIGNGIFGDNNISPVVNAPINLMQSLKKLPYCPIPLPIITSPLYVAQDIETLIDYTITASGLYDSCSVKNLPPGLVSNGCVISGTPLIPGNFNIQICASNTYGTTCENLVVVIISSSSSSSSPGPSPSPSPSPSPAPPPGPPPGPGPGPCNACADYDGGVGSSSYCDPFICEEKYGNSRTDVFSWSCESIVVPKPNYGFCALESYKCEKCVRFCDCADMGYPFVLNTECDCPPGQQPYRKYFSVPVEGPECANAGTTLTCNKCACRGDSSSSSYTVSAVINLDLLSSLLEIPIQDIKNMDYLNLENLVEEKTEETIKQIKNINENK